MPIKIMNEQRRNEQRNNEEPVTFLAVHPKGVTLSLKVQPRSSRPGPQGSYGEKGEFLKWGLKAAPVDGKANEELIGSLSKFFSVPKRSVSILKGETARQKLVLIEGVGVEELRKKVLSFSKE